MEGPVTTLPKAIAKVFGVDEMVAYRMACLGIVESGVGAATDEEIKLLNSWLGSVFAIAEHERRRRAVPAQAVLWKHITPTPIPGKS